MERLSDFATVTAGTGRSEIQIQAIWLSNQLSSKRSVSPNDCQVELDNALECVKAIIRSPEIKKKTGILFHNKGWSFLLHNLTKIHKYNKKIFSRDLHENVKIDYWSLHLNFYTMATYNTALSRGMPTNLDYK